MGPAMKQSGVAGGCQLIITRFLLAGSQPLPSAASNRKGLTLKYAALRIVRSLALLLLLSLALTLSAPAQGASPFAKLAGRWLGEGRLGYAGGKTETVKCRVTYIVSEPQVRQTIRCATEGDTVEVQSIVTHVSGSISGTWRELGRSWSGELSGSVTANGFRVAIKGSELNANMDIIVRDNRQIIEIQFINSSLIGLTLVLNKG
jgi:hypothetical protein